MHPSKIHGISLIISPVITGMVMSYIGYTLRRLGKPVVQIEACLITERREMPVSRSMSACVSKARRRNSRSFSGG